eukprot:TRINITY_DN2277_c0_g3_i1.p1 TRINITY_DN2277_c0_g3~~TRINITY_DN2277_c0_g3_i1.p1  ORF type:complete len:1054 (-),score=226.96 TRINITY_DN2277_c0_g3_i1:19-3180(-)
MGLVFSMPPSRPVAAPGPIFVGSDDELAAPNAAVAPPGHAHRAPSSLAAYIKENLGANFCCKPKTPDDTPRLTLAGSGRPTAELKEKGPLITLEMFLKVGNRTRDMETESSYGGSSSSTAGSDEEQELKITLGPRRFAVSSEARGPANPRMSHHRACFFDKSPEYRVHILDGLQKCPLFCKLHTSDVFAIMDTMPVRSVPAGSYIFQQGEDGNEAFVLVDGRAECLEENDRGAMPTSPLASPRSAKSDAKRMSSTPSASSAEVFTVTPSHAQRRKNGTRVVRSMAPGRVFGEKAMLWRTPRSLSVYAVLPCTLGVLDREVYRELVVHREIDRHNQRQECLRQVGVFESLNDEQIATLADCLTEVQYEEGDDIIRQGDEGHTLYVVLSGECVAIVETGLFSWNRDVQEHQRYGPGNFFGERAVLSRGPRGATVRALTKVETLTITRQKFERLLGSLGELRARSYMSDPRKSIADFYRAGDRSGPAGCLSNRLSRASNGVAPLQEPRRPVATTLQRKDRFAASAAATGLSDVLSAGRQSGAGESGDRSRWFAVYRPTSRDAIAKMLGGEAVGKGLNIKGKSAKRNRLSGLVPFLQISYDGHKGELEGPAPEARLKLFFSSRLLRARARQELEPLLSVDVGLCIETERIIRDIDDYVDGDGGAFGLDVPDPVAFEAFIQRPRLAYTVGWDTGRESIPAYMDMNLHAVREKSMPPVVLWQSDNGNPMNPHGLLMAYAEAKVKPVVSDFDTFTVGSCGFRYEEQLAPDQQELARWSLEQAAALLESAAQPQTSDVDGGAAPNVDFPGPVSWTDGWIDKYKLAAEGGLVQRLPPYGFGDPASYRLVAEVVQATSSLGAVRHGAECFNFLFPQELDDTMLVVWDGFEHVEGGLPWKYMSEEELREFLLERVKEGFTFPLNPVWPIRDPGWYDVFLALMASHDEDAQAARDVWYPPHAGIVERIKELHARYPNGYPRHVLDENDPQRSGHRGAGVNGWEQADAWIRRLHVQAKSFFQRNLSTTSVKALSAAEDMMNANFKKKSTISLASNGSSRASDAGVR